MLVALSDLTCRQWADSPRIFRKHFINGRYPQPGSTLFRLDLRWVCLRQDQVAARIRPRLDELLPALCVAAGAAVCDHVEDTIRRVEQPAVPGRDDAVDGCGIH